MRKILFAMLGLVAIGMWALPAMALPTSGGVVVDGPAKVRPEPVPLENRAGAIGAMARGERFGGTMSGTMIKQTGAATTSWFMYPGVCVQRALNTWVPKTSPVADSLQPTPGFTNSSGYTDNQPDIAGNNNTIAYTRADQSLGEILWHVVNVSVPASQRPSILNGSNSLWCGKFDTNFAVQVGYPNLTFQLLYIDTGAHTANYNFSFLGNLSSEQNYDYNTVIGGGTSGGNPLDPLQNNRALYNDIIPQVGTRFGGPDGNSEQLVSWTGSIKTAQTVASNGGSDLNIVVGAASGLPNSVAYTVTGIPSIHRALYWVFTADCLFSSEDGQWPDSHGEIIDDLATSDNGAIYTDQAPAGGTDPFSGAIVRGTYGTAPFLSCRVAAGIGELWQLAPGTENVTSDICAPQKKLSSDLFFEGGDPNTNLAINKQFNSVVTCTFPVPSGTASIFAQWTEYLDLPRFAGYVQYAEYRIHKFGSWGLWDNTAPGGGVSTGALQAWIDDGDELAKAVQADSFQVRYNLQCIPPFAADRANCSNSQANALLYDNFRIQVTSGVPAPIFGIFPGSVAMSMFVDGTIRGANCQTTPCWPGNRGSDLDPTGGTLRNIAVNDNWNAATGDSITVSVITGLRKNGMGINWKDGHDLTVAAGEDYQARHNGSYNAAFDFPRMIYRLFDPTTKTWSGFDSCQIYANVSVSPTDTTILDSEYAINWPPDDKLRAGASLPGGFTVNGNATYASLRFLPRGSRMQYYFKGVDINGGTSYTFSSDNLAREVEDLPILPGVGGLRAPDIIEFRVLPSAYAAGPAGSLLENRTDTPLLNLDGTYTTWSYGYDPVTQALRGLGVRADRYRMLQGYDLASNIGGHELPGKRPGQLSNFFPNYLEYPIADSLAKWYRIMIQSGHNKIVTAFDEQDATLAEQWWRRDTGSDQGDRCFFVSGDDMFNNLINSTTVDNTLQLSLAQNVFGVSSCANAWSDFSTVSFPTIDDRFSAPGAGPGLAAPGTFTYPIDGGCPGPNKFDALSKVGDANAVAVAFYSAPSSQTAGIAYSRELDNIADKDRSKALGYGFSIQFIRDPAVAPNTQNYTRSGAENRMRVLYKFLTSCRGQRTAAASDTGKCWPCPSPATSPGFTSMQADWAGQSAGFNTSTYGPLYPIQAGALATGVEVVEGEGAPRINKINGNFPNPFNPQTAIRFSSAQAGKGEIRIFSVGGQLVRTLRASVVSGANEVRWNGKRDDGTPLASGVYFYKIVFPNGQSFRAPSSLVLVK
jgi:hypothetical protein